MRCLPGLFVVLVASILASLAVLAPTASAVTTSGWAAWTPITGKADDYATTMTLPAGGFS